jgi:xanthine dehydrogenase YagS FAD-binding subunit
MISSPNRPDGWSRRSFLQTTAASTTNGDVVRQARIALGGVSALPWRAREAEQRLSGQPMNDATLNEVATMAFAQAKPHAHNAFKVQLGKLTLMRALRQAASMEL